MNEICDSALAGKKIILGVTGSIAAYKAAYLASAMAQKGADVHVVMTESATKLVGPATFWSLTSNPVITDMFEPPAEHKIVHVSLPESADLMLIAPATANIIAKLAHGMADDMLSTMALVAKCPIVIAPAMNSNMYTNPLVVANMDRLRNYNRIILEPESGMLACGNEGIGRLVDPGFILRKVEEILTGTNRDYSGVRVMVTAGPTREPIDPVRYITNRSSGKMGYAIAERATRRGAQVVLVSGPTEIPVPEGVELVGVDTVHEMHDAVLSRIDDVSLVISAAAPADFTPAKMSDHKIKKKSGGIQLDLEKTPDILFEVGERKGSRVVVGFAAETENHLDYAAEKLEAKNLDLIVANDVSLGSDTFGSDSNEVTLISRGGEVVKLPRMSKGELADRILDYVQKRFKEELK
jgi:phosphopantothenoylcysteine decarboxylase / phosphopantothenate---cysteine ligase